MSAASRSPARPRKARELQSHHFDSTIWNDFEARVLRELGPECARWLATGELPATAADGGGATR